MCRLSKKAVTVLGLSVFGCCMPLVSSSTDEGDLRLGRAVRVAVAFMESCRENDKVFESEPVRGFNPDCLDAEIKEAREKLKKLVRERILERFRAQSCEEPVQDDASDEG